MTTRSGTEPSTPTPDFSPVSEIADRVAAFLAAELDAAVERGDITRYRITSPAPGYFGVRADVVLAAPVEYITINLAKAAEPGC